METQREVWMCMAVRERPKLTRTSIEAWKANTDRERCGLVVVDCGSEGPVKDYLVKAFLAGDIDRLILNAPGTVPQWQKCYAIRQAYGAVEMESYRFYGWIDNDVAVKPGWLEKATKILSSMDTVEVVSCHWDRRSEASHPTVIEHDHPDAGLVRLKRQANGALWIMRRAFMLERGLPPVGLGKCEDGVEDWHYSYMLRRDLTPRFAVIDAADHLGYGKSQREKIRRGVVWA